jgi:serine/threonine protein kinase
VRDAAGEFGVVGFEGARGGNECAKKRARATKKTTSPNRRHRKKKNASEKTRKTPKKTQQYVAPEVIGGIPGLEYGPKVDAWSAGVVLFVLLGGYPPFWAESEPALFGLVRRGHFTFDDPVWAGVSDG